MKLNLKSKKVLLLGSTGVLGTEYVKQFLEKKVDLVAIDIPSKKFFENKKKYKKAHWIEGNVLNENQVIKSIKDAAKILKKFDVVIYNAAATQESMVSKKNNNFPKFENYPLKLWEKSINVNLTGAFLFARECCKYFSKKGASMIFVSSTYGVVAPDHRLYIGENFKSIPAYSATKAGIIGLSKWLSTWLAPKKIRVNVVVPGGVKNKQSKKFIKNYSNKTPLGRMANRNEIFGIIEYLSNDTSTYTTGQTFVVDGGFTTW